MFSKVIFHLSVSDEGKTRKALRTHDIYITFCFQCLRNYTFTNLKTLDYLIVFEVILTNSIYNVMSIRGYKTVQQRLS